MKYQVKEDSRPMLAEIPTTGSDEITLECMALEMAAQQLDDHHYDDDSQQPLF